MLVMIRNAYGVLTVVVTGAAFLLVSWLTGPDVQSAFAYTAVWFLLLGGVRPAFELQRKRRRYNARGLGRRPARTAHSCTTGALALPLPRRFCLFTDRRRPLAARPVGHGPTKVRAMTETPVHPALWPAPLASKAVDATVTVPGSKSVTNRAPGAGGARRRPGWLRRPLRSRDTLLMAEALRALGVGIEEAWGPTARARPGG